MLLRIICWVNMADTFLGWVVKYTKFSYIIIFSLFICFNPITHTPPPPRVILFPNVRMSPFPLLLSSPVATDSFCHYGTGML
jgi:hypothetical protein